MKKLLLLILLVTYCVMGYGQIKVGEYYSELGEKKFDIVNVKSKKGLSDYYINCHTSDGSEAGFILNEKNVEEFCNALNVIKNKHKDWTKLAKQNNITNYNKPFDVKIKSVTAFFKYGDELFIQLNVPVKNVFLISGGNYIALLLSGKLTATANRYITGEGFMLGFTTEDRIDDFINDFQSAVRKAHDNTATDELFK